MGFELTAFYVLSGFMIFAAICVVAARNPVHSVLFLIAAFFNAAGLFLLLGAEFLALLLLVVYVGAVAVLFLFVVMMLDIDFADLRRGFLAYLPVGGFVGILLMAELVLVTIFWEGPGKAPSDVMKPMPPINIVANTEALGRILYTDFVFLFQAAGMILLVAMIGAIVLTLRSRPGVKRQNIDRQVHRRRDEGVELKAVKSGEGI
ncbi:MAG: NADH-quinone oxidoreductase subunit J [Alphaproteobacteria bacterium]